MRAFTTLITAGYEIAPNDDSSEEDGFEMDPDLDYLIEIEADVDDSSEE